MTDPTSKPNKPTKPNNKADISHCGEATIKEVLLLPTMSPEKKDQYYERTKHAYVRRALRLRSLTVKTKAINKQNEEQSEEMLNLMSFMYL